MMTTLRAVPGNITRREAATKIAGATVRELVVRPTTLQEVIFCCFSARDLAVYRAALKEAS